MADQPKAVTLPINYNSEAGKARALDAMALADCANFLTPHRVIDFEALAKLKQTDPQAHAETMGELLPTAQKCMDTVKRGVRNGTISDIAAMALAVRSIPFTEPNGRDNVAKVLDDVAKKIDVNKNEIGFNFYSPDLKAGTQLVTQAFTAEEVDFAAVGAYRDKERNMTSVQPAGMLPNRTIPVDTSTAYIMTIADVVAHPSNYFPTVKNGVACEPGTADKGCVVDKNALAATIERVRTNPDKTKRYTVEEDRQLGGVCLLGSLNATLGTCQKLAIRDTAVMMLAGEVKPYNAELYSPATVASVAAKQKTTAGR